MTFFPFCCLNLIHIRSISPQPALPTVPTASAASSSPMFFGLCRSSATFFSSSVLILFQPIAGHFGIHLARPGVNTPAQATHILETVALEKSRCVERAFASVIVDDESRFTGPFPEDFLHRFL